MLPSLVLLLACGSSEPTPDPTVSATSPDLDALEQELAATQQALAEAEAALASLAARVEALEATPAADDPLPALCANASALGRCADEPACVDAGACAPRTVFVTGETLPSDLGGLLGADAHCQRLADAAGLDGRYRAWLGVTDDVGGSPLERLQPYDGPYARVDGTVVADDRADLLDGSLDRPIALDATGAPQTGPVWTALQPDGRAVPYDDCQRWDDPYTSFWGYPSTAVTGDASADDVGWVLATTISCNEEARLYCFEDGP